MNPAIVYDGGSDVPVRKNARKSPTCHPERRQHAFGLCHPCYKRKWRAEGGVTQVERAKAALRHAEWKASNPEWAKYRHILAGHKWRLKNKEHQRFYHLSRKYGVSKAVYEMLLSIQGHKCGVCRSPFLETPNLDHCHSTGQVRGLLCRACNHLLGLAKDDLRILRNAARYLEFRQ